MSTLSIPQALQLAFEHHQAGRLAEAEGMYRQVLAVQPSDIEALSLLGLLYAQAGQGAERLLTQAASIDHGAPYIHHRLATAWRALGHMQAAADACAAALAVDPNHVDSLYLLAVTLFEDGQLEPAAGLMERCVALRPAVDLYSDLGVMLEKLGRLPEAEAVYRRGLAVHPGFAPIHTNLGATLAAQGRLEEALAAHRRSMELDPNYQRAYVNLADTAHQLGEMDVALEAARRAVQLNGDDPEAHSTLAEAQWEIGQCEAAAQSFEWAARLLAQAGRPAAQVTAARIMAATVLPQVYESAAEMMRWRARLTANLEALRGEGVKLPLEDRPAPTIFALAYQGLDDRAVLEAYAALMTPPDGVQASGGRAAQEQRRIRVGFLSRFFRDHTIGRLNVGLVEKLDRADFEVIVFSIGDYRDALGSRFRAAADRHIILPHALAAARKMIAEQSPDILFYTDLGMDPIAYTLAHSRLAPIQCTTWGHPVTSGIPAVDYFISSTLLESADSQAQYSEKLATLPHLAVYYDWPQLPNPAKTRADFGLATDAHLYGCLQSLLKFHPEFDEFLGEILRRDPAGVVLLIEGMHQECDRQLKARWKKTIPDVAERIRFMPRLSRDDFLSLTNLCDVMLDPIHFGGGNTSYEAFAFGVPVATLRAGFLRGRLTSAMYALMGILDCIAGTREEYVDIAVTCACDAAHRAAISRRILDAGALLFENLAAVRMLGDFFRSVAVNL